MARTFVYDTAMLGREVEIPRSCPKCSVDLTEPRALEVHGSQSVVVPCAARPGREDPIKVGDPVDTSPLCPQMIACGACGHVFAQGSLSMRVADSAAGGAVRSDGNSTDRAVGSREWFVVVAGWGNFPLALLRDFAGFPYRREDVVAMTRTHVHGTPIRRGVVLCCRSDDRPTEISGIPDWSVVLITTSADIAVASCDSGPSAKNEVK